MKMRFVTFCVCMTVVVGTSVPCFAAAPRVGSTVGSSTVPPSSYQQSLRPARNEAAKYQMRNELITGNVPGGKHFRGDIPYSPRYEFSGPLGSDEINSFLRQSSITPYRDRNPSRYDPYYLPSRTTTSLRRVGQSGLTAPQVTFPGGTGRFQLQARPTKEIYDPNPYRTRRPLELNMSELELRILRQAQKDNPDLRNVKQGIQDDVIRAILSKQEMRETDSEIMVEKNAEQDIEQRTAQKLNELFIDKPEEALTPGEPTVPLEPGEDTELVRSLREITEEKQPGEDIEELIKETIKEPEEEPTEESTDGQETGPTQSEEDKKRFELSLEKMDHQTVMGIIKPHKTFDEYAKASFDTYMALGDGYMAKGKFYKAADAYTLALVYDMESPRAYIGRGMALFAAGEFLTSVNYIEKALSISPEYAKEKIDLKNYVGLEVVDKRLSYILDWYDKNHSPRFILFASYIYYQLGDLDKASESLDAAAEKIPGFSSVKSMRGAIESAKAAKG